MGGAFRWCWSSSSSSMSVSPSFLVHVVFYVWCMVFLCTVSQCHMEAAPAPPSANVGRRGAQQQQQQRNTICDMNGCNCTSEHKYWQIVNCSFDNKQVIELDAGILPPATIELSVTGGHTLKFKAHLFTALKNFQRLRTDNTRNIFVEKHAFLNLTDASLLVQLASCDTLVFETAAFKNILGPLSAEISRCQHVTIQQSAFSFLQSSIFQDISWLDLAEGAFTLPVRELGHHGAVTVIKFRKVKSPSLPKDAFKSSLAEVSFVDSEIKDILPGAFSGNTIAAITITNSSLDRIWTRAFSDRTHLDSLLIAGCQLRVIQTQAMLSAMTNFTIQHSSIGVIETGAINTTIAKVMLHSNVINELHTKGFAIREWNRINIENNTLRKLDEYSMDVPFKILPLLDQYEFTFVNNEVVMIEAEALKFFSDIMPNVSNSRFENNYFRFTCHCKIEKWLEEKLGENCATFSSNNFCTIDSILSQCYEISKDRMNMRNFTDTYCSKSHDINCKIFSADANISDKKKYDQSNNLILGLVLGLVFLVAVCGTAVILLVHGGLWLKRKGYCVRFKSFNYRTEEGSTETEDIMVAGDKVPDNLPEELTQDLLQALREKLENPLTYNEAREMIERLYDHFIIEESYTNNNTRDEETHLYEELGNLPQMNPTAADTDKAAPQRPFSFLRLIEERFNLTPSEVSSNHRPSVLVDEYSEPTDAEVHLYSELPQNFKEGKQNEINEGLTQRSNGSGRMTYRPLPDKPGPGLLGGDPGEGPSTQL